MSPGDDMDTDVAARRAAQAASAGFFERVPEDAVTYRSQGRVLVIGPQEQAVRLAGKLQTPLRAWVLDPGRGRAAPGETPPLWFAQGRVIRLDGHLGDYRLLIGEGDEAVDLGRQAGEEPHFDLVVDMGARPLLRDELVPFGYYHLTDVSDEALEALGEELAGMVGEFEKPRFFDYRPDICAHGYGGLQGCRRCIDACPAGAIESLQTRVQVDPYLCQGGGACVAACPSGAMRYALPRASAMIDGLRRMLQAYREHDGSRPWVVFHDSEAGARRLAEVPLPGNVLCVPLEELAGVGLEVWLSALAFGAQRVGLLDSAQVPQRSREELERQLEVCAGLLEGLGYPTEAVARVGPDENAWRSWLDSTVVMPELDPAAYAGLDDKRETLFFALDHLSGQASVAAPEIPLPAHAPLGTIRVDAQACTLCMACVSICPTHALAAGGGEPRLELFEGRCVQCGLCELGCPEQAVTRETRLLTDPERRRQPQQLNAEAPFECIVCGSAFASQAMIMRMAEKLSTHHMFQGERAQRRLYMCGECRTRDMLQEELERSS
ncbi:MAG: 4Fe-4S binding protein [Acidihalobacter sp.]